MRGFGPSMLFSKPNYPLFCGLLILRAHVTSRGVGINGCCSPSLVSPMSQAVVHSVPWDSAQRKLKRRPMRRTI